MRTAIWQHEAAQRVRCESRNEARGELSTRLSFRETMRSKKNAHELLGQSCVTSARRWWRSSATHDLSNAYYEHFSWGKVVICREGHRVRM